MTPHLIPPVLYVLIWACILPSPKGFVDYLTTEISTSKQKKFPLVTFIDTPGLVDGDMEYPFDVDAAITMLGDMADLIFVLFDPIGQALCKRTLNIVGKLPLPHMGLVYMYIHCMCALY